MGRTLIAGVLAGVALFAWGAVSHMVLGSQLVDLLGGFSVAGLVLAATVRPRA